MIVILHPLNHSKSHSRTLALQDVWHTLLQWVPAGVTPTPTRETANQAQGSKWWISPTFPKQAAGCSHVTYPLVIWHSYILKMTIYSGFSHWKWWFSIVMFSLPEGNYVGTCQFGLLSCSLPFITLLLQRVSRLFRPWDPVVAHASHHIIQEYRICDI
jgi:hypothetical protein